MPADALALGVVGASGRMGRSLIALSRAVGHRIAWEMTSAGECASSPSRELPEVVVDISRPAALPAVLGYCTRYGIALVEGTSGLEGEHLARLRVAAQRIGVLIVPNFAVGHALQIALLDRLAALAATWDVDGELTVLDRHTTAKADRPSATALRLAAHWAGQTGRGPSSVDSVRAGLEVSDHEVTFTLAGELISLRHHVADRQAAARGALRCATWLRARRGPGLWTSDDVYEAPSSALVVAT